MSAKQWLSQSSRSCTRLANLVVSMVYVLVRAVGHEGVPQMMSIEAQASHSQVVQLAATTLQHTDVLPSAKIYFADGTPASLDAIAEGENAIARAVFRNRGGRCPVPDF